MSTPFDSLKSQYAEQFRLHGDTPAALFTPKGKQELRFRAVDAFLKTPGARILDYGCGLGYLARYLASTGLEVNYTGVDILPDFIAACRAKFPPGSTGACHANFELVEPDAALAVVGDFDVVFASGVFNLKIDGGPDASRAYTFRRLRELFTLTRGVLICDFLSGYVDFQQEGGMHFGVDEIAGFCVQDLSRRFQIRHDLLPYEFTLIAHRDGTVKHPESIYTADLSAYIPPTA